MSPNLQDYMVVGTASTVSVSVMFNAVNTGLAFVSLLLATILTGARLWTWYEERKMRKARRKSHSTARRDEPENDTNLFY